MDSTINIDRNSNMDNLQNELDMFKQLSSQGTPAQVAEVHTDFLIGIKRDIHENHKELTNKIKAVDKKVEDLGWIEIVNGDGKDVPKNYERNVYHQMIYNRIAELKKVQDEKVVIKNSLLNFNWWIHNLIPLATVIGIITTLILLALGQRELAKELQQVIPNIPKQK